MIKICALSGSLRKASSNTALLRAASTLTSEDVEISLFSGLGLMPPFNPDLEGMEAASVLDFRDQIRKADAVLISSPEYAHGITGVLKNALDWIVGSGELTHKPVALINASPRATIAQASLKEIIKTMDAHVLTEATIPLSHPMMTETDILAHPEFSKQLKTTLDAFIFVIKTTESYGKIFKS